ncbi:MAG: DUF58 domain-containing protein [Cytophagales bacterium]|nr:DUF58 domain-containing protein [Armatimonadota bacterium]
MTFTRRFFWLVALGIVPLLLSGLFAPLALLGALWNLVVVALAVTDYLLCASPQNALSAERTADEALSVAAENTVLLKFRNETRQRIRGVIRDEPPPEFALASGGSARQQAFSLQSFEVRSFEYSLTPPARGNFLFGDVYARITGPLGLIVRQGQIPASEPVAVFPNLQAVEDYDLMMRRANKIRQGVRRTRIAGGGREFSSLRDYTPDDGLRVVDWKATARRGKLIARTFEAERSQDVLLLIDLGRLMRQEIAQTQKLDHVVNAALMLAHVVAEADDRVGLLTFADETRAWLPPRRGRAQAGDILQALYSARAEIVESDYRAAFRFLSSRWRKRSLAVVFTDLSDPESSAMLLAEIAQLARAHLVVCVLVSDPLVAERARQSPKIATQIYEKAVAEEVQSDRQNALALLQKRGVLVVDAEPSELSVELVARYLMVKSRALL